MSYKQGAMRAAAALKRREFFIIEDQDYIHSR